MYMHMYISIYMYAHKSNNTKQINKTKIIFVQHK